MDKVNLYFAAGKLRCIGVRHLVVSPTEDSSRVSGFENNEAVLSIDFQKPMVMQSRSPIAFIQLLEYITMTA